MSKYKAGTRADIEGLMGTPAMKSLISGHLKRVKELIASFPKVDEIAADGMGGTRSSTIRQLTLRTGKPFFPPGNSRSARNLKEDAHRPFLGG